MSVSRRRETSNSTNTTTPTNPAWVTQSMQDYTNRVGQISGMDAASLVPGASGLQQQAFQGATNLGGPMINLGGYGGNPGAGYGGGNPTGYTPPPSSLPGQLKDDPSNPQVNGGGGDGYVSRPGGGQPGGMGGGYGANVYDLAGQLAFGAGTAGANLMGGTALSRATGYNPTGQAQTQGYVGQGYTAGGPATADGYTASGPAGGRGYTASGPYAPQGYDPSLATSQGYTGQGYTASGQANAQGYDPTMAGSQGYQAGMIDPRAFQVGQTQVGPMAQASARNFTDANFSAYENPYQQSVTDATIADLDASDGRLRAQQSAQQAANGGVRNSNNAVLSALTEGELSRARASSLAGIRSHGFDTAAGLITGDNDRQANVSVANAGFTNQRVLAQAQADSSRNNLQAQLQSAGLLSNQSAYNEAAQFGAGAANTAGLTNAGASNAAASQLAGARNTAALDYAGRTDQAGQFTAGQQNQANQFNSGLNAQTSQFNAGQTNDARSLLSQQLQQAGLDYTGRQDQANQFGANAFNQSALDFAGRSDQAGQFGADARNRSALDFAGRQDQAGAFGAGATNDANRFGANAFNTASLDAASRRDQASQFGANARNTNSMFNAGALNDTSRFNAGQQDTALSRALQAAGLMTNLGSTMGADNRANIGLQADLGGQQREIERQRRAAELDLLARQGDLYGAGQFGLFNGSTSTGSGTTTQTGMNLDVMRAIQAGASIASGISDVRAKTNIQPLGQGPSGDPLYSFNYRDQPQGAPSYIGPMAQEVAQTNPQAVGKGPNGLLTVDYNALGVPSPDQQDAQRDPSLAPANDPLDGWQRMTGDMGGMGAQLNQQQMARAKTGARPRRGLFGGRMVG